MRIAFNIGIIISCLYLPWWLGALLVLVGCFMIRSFFEVILYGIAVDALYGTKFGFHGFAYTATFYTLCVFTLSAFLRERITW